MGWPVVIVSSGGLPVTEVTSGFGTPVEVASNGFGTPVTVVASGGLPVLGTGGGSPPDPGPFPTILQGFQRGEVDDPSNTDTTVDQTFLPTDVDVANNRINLTGLNFPTFGSYSSAEANTVVYTTTGTPFGGIANGQEVYLSAVTGGVAVYPVATAADAATIPTMVPGETIFPIQNYAQQVNRINITSQGTGVHRFTSKKLISQFADLTGSGFPISRRNPNNHSSVPVEFDEKGRPYIVSRHLAKNHNEPSASNSVYGRSPLQTGDKFAARQAVANKRTIVHFFVAKYEPTRPKTFVKASYVPANVNTTTGVLTHNKRGTAGSSTSTLSTGFRVRLLVDLGGTLPAGYAAATDYFVRASGSTVTLHPTAADATANTSVIIPTTQGTVGFTLYMPDRYALSARQRFLTEMLDPATSGGNVLSPGWEKINYAGGNNTLTITSDFITGGGIGATGRTIFPTISGAILRCYFDFPAAAVGPTRVDTGQPMTSGWYWVIRSQTSSAYAMAFDDGPAGYAAAAAALAANQTYAAAPCIKFTAPSGSGYVSVFSEPRPFSIGTATGTEVLPTLGGAISLPPSNEIMALALSVDYNDPAASFHKHRIFKNLTKIAEYETDGVKGLTGAALNDGSPLDTIMNSAAGHVTFEGRLYAWFFVAKDTAVTDEEIMAYLTWYTTKYGLAA